MKQNIIETATVYKEVVFVQKPYKHRLQYNNQNYSIKINLAMHDWHFVSCGIEHSA